MLDISNYNGVQIGISAVEGGITTLIPIGVSKHIISPVTGGGMQLLTGTGAEVAREVESNSQATSKDYVTAGLRGLFNSAVALGISNLVESPRYVGTLKRGIEYIFGIERITD